jgi:hypothetical protein
MPTLHYFETDLFETRQRTNQIEGEMRPRYTVDQAAKYMQLQVYDTALPQPWWDRFRQVTGEPPQGIVWCYDRLTAFGEPIALTTDAQQLLDKFNRAEAITSRLRGER